MVVLLVDHPLAHEKEITAAQLDGVELMSADPAYSVAAPIVKAWFAQENSQPNIVQVATNILVTMNLVGMGLGVTLIPGYMNNFNTGQVVFRPIAGNVSSIALLMALLKGEMKPALRDLHRHCAGTFGKRNGIIVARCCFCNMRRGSQFFDACELALQTSGSRLDPYFSTCTNIRLTPD